MWLNRTETSSTYIFREIDIMGVMSAVMECLKKLGFCLFLFPEEVLWWHDGVEVLNAWVKQASVKKILFFGMIKLLHVLYVYNDICQTI